MLKIMTLLPQIKPAEVKKNDQVVIRMTVRRTSYYFSWNRRLRFSLKNNFHFACFQFVPITLCLYLFYC